jgi:hypothetical protein
MLMEHGTYYVEAYRRGIQIGRAEPFTGFRLVAERFALRKGQRSSADFVRVLNDGLEIWSQRLAI